MNAPPVCVRPATADDLPQLQHIEADAASRFPAQALGPSAAGGLSLDELAACLQSQLLWVAEQADTGAVGFIAARSEGTALHIVEMDVLTSHGQRGIGALLLHRAFDAAKERGHRWITLTTFEHLAWNAPFYARHGFVVRDDLAAWPHLARTLQSERHLGLLHRVAMVADCQDTPRA